MVPLLQSKKVQLDCKKEGSITQQAKQMLTLRISLHKRSSVNTKEERTKRKGRAFSGVGTFSRIFQLCVFVSISFNYQEQDVVEQHRAASCALNQSLKSESFL